MPDLWPFFPMRDNWLEYLSLSLSSSNGNFCFLAFRNRTNLPVWLSRHDNIIICSIDTVSASLSCRSVDQHTHRCLWRRRRRRKRTRSFQFYAYYVYQKNWLYLFEEKKNNKNICWINWTKSINGMMIEKHHRNLPFTHWLARLFRCWWRRSKQRANEWKSSFIFDRFRNGIRRLGQNIYFTLRSISIQMLRLCLEQSIDQLNLEEEE